MPSIYLSPSLQEYNAYLTEGTEEQYMNLLADALEPYLIANGIEFTRNRPDMTLSEAIEESNAGDYDLHLALHSNAAPPNLSGRLTGADVYYFETSPFGKAAADIIAENYKDVYYEPDKVRSVPTTSLRELRRTVAPAVLIETAYHDNAEDEAWIKENINAIAENIARSLTEYFGIPFTEI